MTWGGGGGGAVVLVVFVVVLVAVQGWRCYGDALVLAWGDGCCGGVVMLRRCRAGRWLTTCSGQSCWLMSTPMPPPGTDRRRDGCCWRPDGTRNAAPRNSASRISEQQQYRTSAGTEAVVRVVVRNTYRFVEPLKKVEHCEVMCP